MSGLIARAGFRCYVLSDLASCRSNAPRLCLLQVISSARIVLFVKIGSDRSGLMRQPLKIVATDTGAGAVQLNPEDGAWRSARLFTYAELLIPGHPISSRQDNKKRPARESVETLMVLLSLNCCAFAAYELALSGKPSLAFRITYCLSVRFGSGWIKARHHCTGFGAGEVHRYYLFCEI